MKMKYRNQRHKLCFKYRAIVYIHILKYMHKYIYINMQYKYGMNPHTHISHTLSHTHTQAHSNSVYIRNHAKQRNEY